MVAGWCADPTADVRATRPIVGDIAHNTGPDTVVPGGSWEPSV
jgi:hypothetical protein